MSEEMDSKKYQIEAAYVDRPTYKDVSDRLQDDQLIKILHSAIGIGTEAGEVLDAVKRRMFYNTELDIENLKEECGDILWYMTRMLSYIGSNFEEVMAMNNSKLRKRYPEGFTTKSAVDRLDKTYG